MLLIIVIKQLYLFVNNRCNKSLGLPTLVQAVLPQLLGLATNPAVLDDLPLPWPRLLDLLLHGSTETSRGGDQTTDEGEESHHFPQGICLC